MLKRTKFATADCSDDVDQTKECGEVTTQSLKCSISHKLDD